MTNQPSLQKLTSYNAQTHAKYDQLFDHMDECLAEIKTLILQRWSPHQQKCFYSSYSGKPQIGRRDEAQGVSIQNQHSTLDLQIDFQKQSDAPDEDLSKAAVNTAEEDFSDHHQSLFDDLVADPASEIMNEQKSVDPTPFFFDPPLTGEDDTEKSPIVANPITDPNSEHPFFVRTIIGETQSPGKRAQTQGAVGNFQRPPNTPQRAPILTQNPNSTTVSEAGFSRMGGSMDKEVDRVFSQKPSAPNQNLLSTQNYMADFQVTPYPEHCLNNCITELEHTTQTHVKMSKPTPKNLEANLYDLHDTSKTTVGVRRFPNSSNTPCFRSKPIFNKTPRSFNASEMADKEAKGLCMFCDELFTPGHLLKHKRFKLLVMEREEEDESIYEEVEVVDGKALGDCGNTCEFSELDLTPTLSGKLETIIPLPVPDVGNEGVPTTRSPSDKNSIGIASEISEEKAVDRLQVTIQEKFATIGGNEIALLCLGMMHFNLGYPPLALEALTNTVSVSKHHLFVLLKGSLKRAGNSFETPLGKLTYEEIQDHKLLKVVDCFSMGLHDNFDDSSGLPIHRAGFDHTISLMEGFIPFKLTSYSYFHSQKYLIGNAVENLLQLWPINDIVSPYALPTVLVRRNDVFTAILHRKMIKRGHVMVPNIMLKWRTLPPKHGTWVFATNIDDFVIVHDIVLVQKLFHHQFSPKPDFDPLVALLLVILLDIRYAIGTLLYAHWLAQHLNSSHSGSSGANGNSYDVHIPNSLRLLNKFSTAPVLSNYVIDVVWVGMKAIKFCCLAILRTDAEIVAAGSVPALLLISSGSTSQVILSCVTPTLTDAAVLILDQGVLVLERIA